MRKNFTHNVFHDDDNSSKWKLRKSNFDQKSKSIRYKFGKSQYKKLQSINLMKRNR